MSHSPQQNTQASRADVQGSENHLRPRKRQRSTSAEGTVTNGHATPTTLNGQTVIPLEPSYFGVAPHDDFTREVGNWLLGWCKGREHVEIEAKIGILLDTSVPRHEAPRRLYFPVATESIITDPGLCRFESNMTAKQHVAFNALLNMRVQDQASPSYTGARIKYQHTKEVDYFHSTPDGKKVRVSMTLSKDGKTLTPKPNGIVEKERIANMNIYSPKQGFDFRISVSAEKPLAIAPANKPSSERFKDRISYSHQIVQVDLTSVTAREPTSHRDVSSQSYELEVEFKNVAELMREGAKQAMDEPQPNLYFEMVQVFLNTIRMLIKNADDP